MKNHMEMACLGMLIRKRRIEKNYSLEGLSRGICALSYLSKIEKGTVVPADDILEQLFHALDMHYEQDEAFLEEVKEKLEVYYNGRLEMVYENEAACWLKANQARAKNSRFYLDMALFELFEMMRSEDNEHNDFSRYLRSDDALSHFYEQAEALEKLRCYMSDEQKFWLYDLKWYSSDRHEDALEYAKKMCALKDVSYARRVLTLSYSDTGQMLRALEEGNKCYEMACDEGNVWMMAEISVLIGNVYSNRGELALMAKYYDRALKISRFIEYDKNVIYYNTGATYIQYGQYAQGIQNLLKIKIEKTYDVHYFMYCHKLMIAYGELGNDVQCRYYLQEAGKVPEKLLSDSMKKMCRMLELRYFEDYAHLPEYECLLKDIYENIQQEFSYGYKLFHRRFLVELYKKQRRYKEALLIMEEDSDENGDE